MWAIAYTTIPKRVFGIVMYQNNDRLAPMQITVSKTVVLSHSIMWKMASHFKGKS